MLVVISGLGCATWHEVSEAQREVGITFQDLAIPVLQLLLPGLQWLRNILDLFPKEK